MKYSQSSDNTYTIRLEKGEEVNASIKSFCKTKQISNCYFVGVGSVENPTLAHYRVNTKKYSEKNLQGIFEVINITGNVGIFENEPLVHSHISLSDDSMQACGGHLVETAVSATLELFVTVLNSKHTKSFNEEIGLKLWDLP